MTNPASLLLPECTQLIHQLFYFLDQSDYEQLVALFRENGILHRQGEVLHGPARIMQAMKKRSATQQIRHVISNVFIESQSAAQVDVVAYMVAYRFDDGSVRTGPADIRQPFRMSVVRATLQATQETLKIAEMSFNTQFNFANDAQAGAMATNPNN